MVEKIIKGDELESIVTEVLDVKNYNSVRFWYVSENGEKIEVAPNNNLKMVIYLDEEDEEDFFDNPCFNTI